jgi:hypothetical protein
LEDIVGVEKSVWRKVCGGECVEGSVWRERDVNVWWLKECSVESLLLNGKCSVEAAEAGGQLLVLRNAGELPLICKVSRRAGGRWQHGPTILPLNLCHFDFTRRRFLYNVIIKSIHAGSESKNSLLPPI